MTGHPEQPIQRPGLRSDLWSGRRSQGMEGAAAQSEGQMSDLLEDIFRMIRLEACVYFQRTFNAPWAMQIGPTQMAQFHLVLEGTCVAEVDGAVVHAAPGDVLLFPRGAVHVLADREGRDPVPGADAMASFATDAPMFAGNGVPTKLICGHYAYRTRPVHPLIDGLPELVHVSARTSGAELEAIVGLLIAETRSSSQGSTSIVERLAEVLLVRTLRAWLAVEAPSSGFLHGMTDRRLSRALIRIHRDFEHPLTLESLAGDAGMSRSRFAERFKDVTGLPAIEYLAQWRMLSAGGLLADSGLSIPEVAVRSGYGSDLAFARAFKRTYGMTPAEWRRQGAPS